MWRATASLQSCGWHARVAKEDGLSSASGLAEVLANIFILLVAARWHYGYAVLRSGLFLCARSLHRATRVVWLAVSGAARHRQVFGVCAEGQAADHRPRRLGAAVFA